MHCTVTNVEMSSYTGDETDLPTIYKCVFCVYIYHDIIWRRGAWLSEVPVELGPDTGGGGVSV